MPPPKKPKTGPTTAEQFLSEEELERLEQEEVQRRKSASESKDGNTEEITTQPKSHNGSDDDSFNSSSDQTRTRQQPPTTSGYQILRRLFTHTHTRPTSVPHSGSVQISDNGSVDKESSLQRTSSTSVDSSGTLATNPGIKIPDLSTPTAPESSIKSSIYSSSNIVHSPLSGTTQGRIQEPPPCQLAVPFQQDQPFDLTLKCKTNIFNGAIISTANIISNSLGSSLSHLPSTSKIYLRQQQQQQQAHSALTLEQKEGGKDRQGQIGKILIKTENSGDGNSRQVVSILTEPGSRPVIPVDTHLLVCDMSTAKNAREMIDKSASDDVKMLSPDGCSPVLVGNFQTPTSTTVEMAEQTVGSVDSKRKQDSVLGSNSNRLCQVCNDNASGFHYGVWSCEGCKAFFKRSIQGPVDYVCPATNNCTIDKHRRKSCQACRLRKCYDVGMNKGSQRKERKSSSSQSKPKRNSADFSDATVNSTSGNQPAKSPRMSKSSILVEELIKTDLPVLKSDHNHSIPPTKLHLLQSLICIADQELVHLITWAKHVPGYTDLSLIDQVHLIECCWMELLVLNCAFRSMEHEGKRLAFASNFILERLHWDILGMTHILDQIAAVSEQLLHFSVNKEELMLLQATVLVNAEVRRLSSFSKIDEIRQIILDALTDMSLKYHPDNPRHVPSTLLLLTHVRQAADRSVTYLQQQKAEGHVIFCDLIKEMLEAQNTLIDRKLNYTES